MEHANGQADGSTSELPVLVNGHHPDRLDEPTLEDLERELPVVYDGQVPLGDLLSRVVQSIYAELCELAETMPNMSDSARKRTLADWVVKTKKQVVKLYAVVVWSRDAETVQKCMNITAFLMGQHQQFNDAIDALQYAKTSLDPARLRNHDLLTSLDVLTTGSYRRLPSAIKKLIIPPEPLTDAEVLKTLSDMEDAIRYRLRMSEIMPIEMSRHRIADGRVSFTVPKLFECSICLRGAEKDAAWLFVSVEFLFTVGGDPTGMQEFPRIPSGIMKRHITDEANARLTFYSPIPPDQLPSPGVDIPPRPHLPEGVIDAPLVRLYNFLHMMSLSYQLQILWYQAETMRSLGWADYLKIDLTNNQKTLTASYWIRQPPKTMPGRQNPRFKLPLVGGTLSISIVEAQASTQAGGGPARSPQARVLAELQRKSKLGKSRPSDEVEGLRIEVRWEPTKGAMGVNLPPSDLVDPLSNLSIDTDNLDFESLLRSVIDRHIKAILTIFQFQLQQGPTRTVFSPPGTISLIVLNNTPALRAHLCAEEVVIVTIDPRTGKINLRDTGDLAAAGRSQRFELHTDRLNLNPTFILDTLSKLRLTTIIDLAEQKAQYLGLHSFRSRNFLPEELRKLGPAARAMLYIQLSNFPNHYLVLVVTDDFFRYALISVKIHSESAYANMTMEDIGWLDVNRIHGEDALVPRGIDEAPSEQTGHVLEQRREGTEASAGSKQGASSKFNLDAQLLRELYSYCCARVAYTKVEQQFKLRGIPYTHVNPSSGTPVTPAMDHIQSSLARSVPALCVQSSDILSGAPAAEAAMPNIRVIPLNWWSEKKAQVVTCVKLKYVQQPMGKTAATSNIIRPSKRIIYDTTEAVVSFLSEDVDTCVDEFLEEWARVSKMVVIAREVAQMAKDGKRKGVRLLSFDLQTVEFAYVEGYTVSITCTDQLSPSGGSFELRFSRCQETESEGNDDADAGYNPHSESEPFFRNILRHGHGRLASSLHQLVCLLRDTLPMAAELEALRAEAEREGLHVMIFAKAAGWHRMLLLLPSGTGTARYGIDWRLMSGDRMVVLDASHSLFKVDGQSSRPELTATEVPTAPSSPSTTKSPRAPRGRPGSPSKPSKAGLAAASSSTSQAAKEERGVSSLSSPDASGLGLQPIPNFRGIVADALLEVAAESDEVGGKMKMALSIDVGVVCDKDVVRAVGRAIHRRVWRELRG